VVKIKIVESAIINLIEMLQENPFIVYSEKDLQTLLSLELLSLDQELVKTNQKYEGNPIKVNRVHREYPYLKIGRRKSFDIVIFSEEDIKKISWKTNSHFGYLHNYNEGISILCSHLIELKNIRKETLKKTSIKSDFEKLREGYHRFEDFKKYPKLFFVCYHLWKCNPKKIRKQLNIYGNSFLDSKKEPVINFFLLIGPEEKWKVPILKDEKLKDFCLNHDKRIFFF